MKPSGKQDQTTPGSAAAALVIWLATQLVALGLCACRTMLWARAPRAGEQLALFVMLAMQIAMSALLFPHLLGNLRSTIPALATALPMAQLAAYLSDAPPTHLVLGELYVWAWMIGLDLWTKMLPTAWSKLLGIGIASMLSLGGPVLWYLRADFGRDGSQLPLWSMSFFGPICGAISQIVPEGSKLGWTIPAIIFAVGLLGYFLKHTRGEIPQQVIH
ncbi:MAG: hypothetical protein ABSD28_01330 [Tepidisphaeraceae bacterium]|jgi:hypothetical protein